MNALRYEHGTEIYVLRTCEYDDAQDLIALGGEHTVEILLVTDGKIKSLAHFHIGSRITSLAWSSRTTSPSSSDDWVLELTAASADFALHILTKSSSSDENIFSFGGGLSGHQGKINEMTFCGGRAEDSARYVATVSDDKMLIIWNLYPTSDVHSALSSPFRTPGMTGTSSPAPRLQPTAYAIPFPYPLTAVCSHPSTAKEVLVADCHGSIFLTDWRSDEAELKTGRCSSSVELVDPSALSDASMGLATQCGGSVSWRRDTVDVIGAVYGSKFSLWDTSKLLGGKPFATGITLPQGGHRFRWCPTYPEYFAISTQSPSKGALVHLHSANYVHAQPTVFTISPRPHRIRDFDWLANSLRGPRIAAAVGRTVVIFSVGMDS